jgi:hypothetical protein
MIAKLKAMFTQEVRGWIYRVLVAVGALLAGYGLLTTDQIALWLGVVVAVLNVMPSANTSVKKPADEMFIPDSQN